MVKKNAPIISAEKVEKAKENIESRRDVFAKSILYDVVQQTGSNIAVTEEMKQKAYNVAKDDEAR